MKKVIILLIVALVVYQYVRQIENGDWLSPLRKIPQDFQRLLEKADVESTPEESAIEELTPLPKPAEESAGTAQQLEDIKNERYVSIVFTQGGVIEGRVIKETDQHDFVLALPGGQFSFSHSEIKTVHEMPPEEALLLKRKIDNYTPAPAPAKKRIAPATTTGPVQWQTDLTAALLQASGRNRLVMADFTTTWCGWCKKLDKDTFQNRTVQQILNNYFVCVKIDGDKHKDLVRKYQVRGYPHIIFMKANGKALFRVPGYVPPKEFVDVLNQVLRKTGIKR